MHDVLPGVVEYHILVHASYEDPEQVNQGFAIDITETIALKIVV